MVHCPVCGTAVTPARGPVRIERCRSCTAGVTIPPPSRDVTGAGLFQEGSYAGSRIERRTQWLREARTRMDWIQEHVSGGRILEVGAATGEFLRVAVDRNFEATGVEASSWAAEHARSFVPEAGVTTGTLGSWLATRPPSADAAAMFHVLEHVDEPVELLKELRAFLRPGGFLFLEVPNADARDARRDGIRWCLAAVEEHFTHFNTRSIRDALTTAGFVVESVTTPSLRLYDPLRVWFARRARWLSRGRFRASADLLRVVARAPGGE